MSDGINKKDWEIYADTKMRLDKTFGFEHDPKSIVRLAEEIENYRETIKLLKEELKKRSEPIAAPLSETLESSPLHQVTVNGKTIFDARDAYEMFGDLPDVQLIININIEQKN